MAVPLGGRGAAPHRPVLLRETIELLAAEQGGLFVDCTVGLGGHSEAILQAARDAQVLGIDRDVGRQKNVRSVIQLEVRRRPRTIVVEEDVAVERERAGGAARAA